MPPLCPSRRALLLAAALLPLAAHAADPPWPAKPIRWVVAYPPGGGSDFLARQLAGPLGRALGQTIVIDNRPGAAGIVGTENAARSAPDGYTIVTGDNGAFVFHSAMYKKLPYDPQEFAPVAFMARFPLILAVNPQSGFTSARQLLDEVKARPGKYSYASPGIGSPHQLAMELLKARTGSYVVHVPYRGTAFAMQDVIAGQLPMMVLDTAAGLPQIRSGKLRALAVEGDERWPELPDVPTLSQAGFDGFPPAIWYGLLAPAKTPPAVIARLNATVKETLKSDEVKAAFAKLGLDAQSLTPQEFGAVLVKEREAWAALAQQTGIKLTE
jgi:tripartite-type tricarboxylate transporter receptor subunit TctC